MPRQTQAVNHLSQIIRAEIAAAGVLPFARFMELALYCPDFGYYETQKDNVGRGGDFITSVSTGALFGQLLAFQFAGWFGELKMHGEKAKILEAGAHDGKLAADILNWLQSSRPQLYNQLEYLILEPSEHRRNWQRETLKPFAPHVRWLSRFNDSTIQRFNGIIFSNELLDAFPVHRYGWDAKNQKWFEWGVTVEGKKFIWKKMPQPADDSRFTIHDCYPFCRTITPSKLRPLPKTGGGKRREFWNTENY